jgi:hypothetical protein
MIQEAGEQKTRRARNQEEARLQAKCFIWCWNEYPETRRLLFHVENEGTHSNAIDGVRRRSMGIVAGVSDLILLIPRGGYHGLCIEMKTTDKKSNQRDDQKSWQLLVEEQGYRYEVIRTEEDFRELIKEYLSLCQQ